MFSLGLLANRHFGRHKIDSSFPTARNDKTVTKMLTTNPIYFTDRPTRDINYQMDHV